MTTRPAPAMPMGRARSLAAALVSRLASEVPIEGAYFIGSMAIAADADELPATSDLDVMVVVGEDGPVPERSKIACEGALIEVSCVSRRRLAEDGSVDYHLAHGLRHDAILLDPHGWLRNLQRQVAAQFADPHFVRRRCDNALGKIERLLASLDRLDATGAWHEQITAWLFATGITTHVLLVAALQNPTVRFRYLAVRALLQRHGHEQVYEELLDLLGCRAISNTRVGEHLDRLSPVFDEAAASARTPFPFSADITIASRRLAIDASRHLIERDDHREAIFWIAVTSARCVAILAQDGSRDRRIRAEQQFAALFADLGVQDRARLRQRATRLAEYLPRLSGVASMVASEVDVGSPPRTSYNPTPWT